MNILTLVFYFHFDVYFSGAFQLSTTKIIPCCVNISIHTNVVILKRLLSFNSIIDQNVCFL